MKFKHLAIFLCVASIGGALYSQSALERNQVRFSNQAAWFETDYFKIADTEVDGFNLKSDPATPTLATVSVYVNGVLKGEGDDYEIAGKQVTLRTPVKNVIVQIRYLAKQ